MVKLDPIKELGDLYKPPRGGPVVVDVPEMRLLMVDGVGDPNDERWGAAVETLYGVSYAIKFAVKKGPIAIDYKVMPLEGLWWAGDMDAFVDGRRQEWEWTAMIAQPPVVPADLVAEVAVDVERKKKLPAIDDLRFEPFAEGRCAQILHIGPYSEEWPTIEKLHSFIAALGGVPTGKHHEIYLGDPRKAAPDKLRTIIRQPFTAR